MLLFAAIHVLNVIIQYTRHASTKGESCAIKVVKQCGLVMRNALGMNKQPPLMFLV